MVMTWHCRWQFSYSTAIYACKNCGQWETALEILEDMKRRGLGRDKHSLNAAIAACASAGRHACNLSGLRMYALTSRGLRWYCTGRETRLFIEIGTRLKKQRHTSAIVASIGCLGRMSGAPVKEEMLQALFFPRGGDTYCLPAYFPLPIPLHVVVRSFPQVGARDGDSQGNGSERPRTGRVHLRLCY